MHDLGVGVGIFFVHEPGDIGFHHRLGDGIGLSVRQVGQLAKDADPAA